MSTGQIIVLAFAGLALLLAAGVFVIAFRRGAGAAGAGTPGEGPPPWRRADRARDGRRPGPKRAAAAKAPAPEAAPVDPLEARPEVSAEEYDVTRRQFFNRGILAVFGIFLLQFAGGALAMMWPKLHSGGFGSKVNAGKVTDIEVALRDAQGRVHPMFVSAAQAYIVPVQGDLTGSQFDGIPVVASGLMALWQKCVHLGCRVPTCDSSQGFECPCHGSKYNYHGEYESGPAPRNLDRFVVTVNDADELIIDTGSIIQTARSASKTAEYPKGPSCI